MMTKSWIVYLKYISEFDPNVFFSASLLDILSSSSKLPFICWENKRGENQIKFTGTPYLILGRCQFQCYQGDDKNVNKKRIFRETHISLPAGL